MSGILGDQQFVVIHADNREVLPGLAAGSVEHVITDPPYSARTHAAAAAAARDLPDGHKRRVYASQGNGFGFDHLDPDQKDEAAASFAQLAKRWVLIFTDNEGVGAWMSALALAKLDHVRIGQWVKVGATPQFTGDRPASGTEAVVISHPKGRKRWNGGGLPAVWTHPTAALEARKTDAGRPEHLTPKPISLMLELVGLFTDPDDVVLDPYCGSGTTGVACLRLGRRFIGIEKDATYAQLAKDRLEAEMRGLSLRDARAGQTSIFDAIKQP